MLTWVDCLSLSELTADEIRAIARHEHLSEMAALEMGSWLIEQPDGCRVLKRMILDELENAVARKDLVGAARLKLVMRHFCNTHPENPRKQPVA
ncbi:MAG: hypothetical protein ABTQ27_00530 [Amaricoccus sp.]|uniref:hypothetical protein n=1 Tax=Amaricoccus sp. TaxID=1872485 RepID=UPI003315A0BE